MRAQREEERQLKLKKAERMAGELGSRAAEMEAELDARVKRAQEEYRYRKLFVRSCSRHRIQCQAVKCSKTLTAIYVYVMHGL